MMKSASTKDSCLASPFNAEHSMKVVYQSQDCFPSTR